MDGTAEAEPSLDRAVHQVRGTRDPKRRRLAQALFKSVFEFPYTRGQYIVNHKNEFEVDYNLICEYVPFFEADAAEMEPWQDTMDELGLSLVAAYGRYAQELVAAMKVRKKKKPSPDDLRLAEVSLETARVLVQEELAAFKEAGSYDIAASHNPMISGSRNLEDFVVGDDDEIEAGSLPSSDEEDYSDEETEDDEEDDQKDSESEEVEEPSKDVVELIDLTKEPSSASESPVSSSSSEEWEVPEIIVTYVDDEETDSDSPISEPEPEPEAEVEDEPEQTPEDASPASDSDSDSEDDTHVNIFDGVTIGTNRTLVDYPYYQTSTVSSALAWDGTICHVCSGQTNKLEALPFIIPRAEKRSRYLACRPCQEQFQAGAGASTHKDFLLNSIEWWWWAEAKMARAELTVRVCEACGIRTTSFLDPPTTDEWGEPLHQTREKKSTICHSCQLYRQLWKPTFTYFNMCVKCNSEIKQPFWRRSNLLGPVCHECDPRKWGKLPVLPWSRISHRSMGHAEDPVAPCCASCGVTDAKLRLKWTSDSSGQPQCMPCSNDLQVVKHMWLQWPLAEGECRRCDVAFAPRWHVVPGPCGKICHWCLYPKGDKKRYEKPRCDKCWSEAGMEWHHRAFARAGNCFGKTLGEILCEKCAPRKGKRARDDEDEDGTQDAFPRTCGSAFKRRKLNGRFVYGGGVDDPTRFHLF